MLMFIEIFREISLGSVGAEYLFDVSLKSAMILFLLICLRIILGYTSASAALRHFVLSTAFLSLLLLPFISFVLPAWHLQFLPKSFISSFINQTSAVLSDNQNKIADEPKNGYFNTADETQSTEFLIKEGRSYQTFFLSNWHLWLLLSYLTGFVWIITRWLIGIKKVTSSLSQASPLTDSSWNVVRKLVAKQMGIRHEVQIYRSFSVTLPITFGFRRPVILLPITCLDWSESRKRTVLLHEFAHISRKDWAFQGLVQIVCALYWFNPLVWIAAQKLRLDAEHACDDIVLEHDTKASDYAGDLLKFARAQSTLNAYLEATVSIAAHRHLEKRLRCILDPNTVRRPLNAMGKALTSVILSCLLLPLAAAQFSDTQKDFNRVETLESKNLEQNNQQEDSRLDAEVSEHNKLSAKNSSSKNALERNSISKSSIQKKSPETSIAQLENPLNPTEKKSGKYAERVFNSVSPSTVQASNKQSVISSATDNQVSKSSTQFNNPEQSTRKSNVDKRETVNYTRKVSRNYVYNYSKTTERKEIQTKNTDQKFSQMPGDSPNEN